MILVYYIPVFFCLASCVSADSWDDFANNLATDLAPLITLFGEQITRQCMSELIGTLDDFIFALVPLGVLTAVVSVIRVCGNSTLRAIIGRAQEDPAESEKEILSCVSKSTAEIFTESGVARITGSPRILEIVADESQAQSGIVNIRELSEFGEKDWTDLEKDARLPNLSLNKGITRRAPSWFHLAASFGVLLQSGIIIYAALTVMYWPQAFLKDGSPVDSYAFPMFVLGTVLLTLGMFLCAVLVERRSIKRIVDLPAGNRAYWIQPGNQTAGDQKFPSFVGRTDTGVKFIRSVRHDLPTNFLNVSREMGLILVVGLTMTGFVIQFVGIRGLHSSVSLAQLGATMVMTLVRTGLRAERMQEGDNLLKDDQDIVSGDELDWLLFHLFSIKSFKILPSHGIQEQSPRTQPNPIIQKPVIGRVRLRKLAGSDWDETPARKMAQNLGQATQGLLRLVQPWNEKEIPYFDITIPIEIQKNGNQQAISDSWNIRLLPETEVDIDFWDALIGLYVWSIKRQNSTLIMKKRQKFVKAFDVKGKDAHQARLLYRKWTNDNSILEHNHPHSIACLDGCETVRCLRSSGGSQTDRRALIMVTSDYYTLAVQDIYVHILRSMLKPLPVLGGSTQIIGHDKKTYRFSNDRIEGLLNAFILAGLGDRREGIICILSVLSDLGLLPESTYDSVEVRRHMQKLEKMDNNETFTVSEWLCSLADHEEVKHVMAEYGYICLRNLMDRDDGAKSFALERIMAILKENNGSQSAKSISTYLTKMESIPSESWCKNYRNQLFWITARILQFQPIGNHFPRVRMIFNDFEKLQPIQYELSEVYQDQQEAALSKTILLDSWFELDYGDYLSNEHTRRLLDWLFKNRHDSILEWFVIRMINELSPNYSHDNMKSLLSYATTRGYREAVEIIWRHIDRFNIRVYVLQALASDGDVHTLEEVLGCDFSGQSTTDHECALLKAAEEKQPAVIKYLLMGGIEVDAQNSEGRTALMIAAMEGDLESLTLLRSYNASLDIRDNSGDTALIHGVVHSHVNIVESLIDQGADVNTRDLWGRTLLILATLHKSLPLIEYLCEHGADINALDDNQINAVDVAARGDNINGPWLEGYAFLSSRGAKPNVARGIGDYS